MSVTSMSSRTFSAAACSTPWQHGPIRSSLLVTKVPSVCLRRPNSSFKSVKIIGVVLAGRAEITATIHLRLTEMSSSLSAEPAWSGLYRPKSTM